MTGPEHYREAERLLGEATSSGGYSRDMLRAAELHARLAHVAATALVANSMVDSNGELTGPKPSLEEWRDACRLTSYSSAPD